MSFADLRAGDFVKFRVPTRDKDKPFRTVGAKVLRFLVFDTHVMVDHGNNGTRVDARNFISQVIR